MKFYTLEAPYSFWGNYSDILVHGMVSHSKDIFAGLLLLERTGPYIPPVSFPGGCHVVITDEFKGKLESSGLSGITFQPVIKEQMVELDWHKWDDTLDDPPIFPETGEPEDYILEKPHSPDLAEKMGPLWELVVEVTASVEKVAAKNIFSDTKISFIPDSWNGDDIFRAHDVHKIYLSEKAKNWFYENAGKHVAFRELKQK